MLICLTFFSGSTSSDQALMIRGFSGLPGNFWSKHIRLMVECGRLIPAQSLPLLGSFSLELVHCAWTTIPWHSNLDPFLWHPSGVQSARSLPAAGLSLTASSPGKRGKAELGDRGKAEQSRHVNGRAITACYRGWSAHLVVSSETLWKAVLEGAAPPLLPFWPFSHFVYSRQLAVSSTLHASRLRVGGHNRMKTKAMSKGWCMWGRKISVYTFFSWDVPFQDGKQGV